MEFRLHMIYRAALVLDVLRDFTLMAYSRLLTAHIVRNARHGTSETSVKRSK